MLERLGIADEAAARREKFKRYTYRAPAVASKTHRITVNLSTGERTVESAVDTVVKAPDPVAPVVIDVSPQAAAPASEPAGPLAVEPARILCAIRPRNAMNNHAWAVPDTRGRVADVVGAASAAFGITVAEFLSESHARRCAYPRFAASHFLYNVLRISLPSIGKAVKRDHSSVKAGIRKAAELRRTDIEFAGRSRLMARELRRKWSAK